MIEKLSQHCAIPAFHLRWYNKLRPLLFKVLRKVVICSKRNSRTSRICIELPSRDILAGVVEFVSSKDEYVKIELVDATSWCCSGSCSCSIQVDVDVVDHGSQAQSCHRWIIKLQCSTRMDKSSNNNNTTIAQSSSSTTVIPINTRCVFRSSGRSDQDWTELEQCRRNNHPMACLWRLLKSKLLSVLLSCRQN